MQDVFLYRQKPLPNDGVWTIVISQLNQIIMENQNKRKNRGGRPKLSETEKQAAQINIRCSIEQYNEIKKIAKDSGLSMTDYLLKRALNNKIVYNYNMLIDELNTVGTEFSRAGNNINQLAKHANSLSKSGNLDKSLVERLNLVMVDYAKKYDEMRVLLRSIRRELTK